MTEHADFDLLIARSAEDEYEVRVVESPGGFASGRFVLPVSDLEFENFLLRIGQPARASRSAIEDGRKAARDVGTRLYEALFDGDVGSAWDRSLAAAEEQGKNLRLRLRLTTVPRLAELPWEYLYSTRDRRFLALSAETPLVRDLEASKRHDLIPVTPPLRILAVISSPTDVAQLDTEAEWSKLSEALSELIDEGKVVLDRTEVATLEALREKLLDETYHVFHFVGHGHFRSDASDGELMFEDENGRGRAILGEDLGTILRDEKLMLAVLNSCEGARSSRNDPLAGAAQGLVHQGVAAVVAMQFEITDVAAIAFARGFYAAIARGHPVDAALTEGRKAIFTGAQGVEWGTPVLYMHSPNGHLFDIDDELVEEAATEPAEPEPVEPIDEPLTTLEQQPIAVPPPIDGTEVSEEDDGDGTKASDDATAADATSVPIASIPSTKTPDIRLPFIRWAAAAVAVVAVAAILFAFCGGVSDALKDYAAELQALRPTVAGLLGDAENANTSQDESPDFSTANPRLQNVQDETNELAAVIINLEVPEEVAADHAQLVSAVNAMETAAAGMIRGLRLRQPDPGHLRRWEHEKFTTAGRALSVGLPALANWIDDGADSGLSPVLSVFSPGPPAPNLALPNVYGDTEDRAVNLIRGAGIDALTEHECDFGLSTSTPELEDRVVEARLGAVVILDVDGVTTVGKGLDPGAQVTLKLLDCDA